MVYSGSELIWLFFVYSFLGWLYLGSFILVSVFTWGAGHLIERMYHERWWDYSNRRWNVEGYISLVDSALWGALAMVMMKWGNALVVQLFRMIPGLCRGILIWLLVIFLFVDIMVTLLALRGKREKMKQLAKVEGWFKSSGIVFGMVERPGSTKWRVRHPSFLISSMSLKCH